MIGWRNLGRALAALWLWAWLAPLHAANLVSVTLTGPQIVDSQSRAWVDYVATANWDDGTSTDVSAQATWSTTSGAIAAILGGRAIAGPAGDTVVGVSFAAPPFAPPMTTSLNVSVVDGVAPWIQPQFDCIAEDPVGFAVGARQQAYVGASVDIVPACGAHVIIANTALGRIQVVDLRSGAITGSAQLAAEPMMMRRVPGTPYLFVSLWDYYLARVDLRTGEVAYAPIEDLVRDMAPGEPGELFVIYEGPGPNYPRQPRLTIFDVETGERPMTMALWATFIRYDQASKFLLAVSADFSVTNLSRYTYAPATRTLLSTAPHGVGREDVGHPTGGREMALSPDGTRVVWVTTSGNAHHLSGNPSTLFDFDTTHIQRHRGEFGVGTFPYSFDFRADGLTALSLNHYDLQVFDVATHLLIASWPLAPATADPCLSKSYRRARYSPAGQFGYAFGLCTGTGQYSTITFVALGASISPPTPQYVAPPGLALDCAHEDTSGFAPNQLVRLNLPDGDDLVAGCDGKVLVGSRTSNRLQTIDVRTGAVIGTSQLQAKPMRLRRIPGTIYVMASLRATALARVDMSTGAVVHFPVNGLVYDFVAGEPGQVMVLYKTPNQELAIAIVDVASGAILAERTVYSMERQQIQYDRATRTVFLAQIGNFWAEVHRYSFDPVSRTFTALQSSTSIANNGNVLILSPDGRHLALGNHSPTVRDTDPTDLSSSSSWQVGAASGSMDFRRDSRKLLVNGVPTAGGGFLKLFDVTTRALDRTWDLGDGCRSPVNSAVFAYSLSAVRFSPSGAFAYAIGKCGALNADPGSVLWAIAPRVPAPRRKLDLDADSKDELLFENTDGRSAVWLMNGLAIASSAEILPAGTGWQVSHFADLDGDGKSDLVWRNPDGRAAAYLMNGLAPGAMQQLLDTGSDWTVTHTGDLDGDGKSDLVFRHADGTIAAWLMNGTAMSAGATLLAAGSGWSVARVADFDGNNKSDLLFTHTDGRVAIWIMDGLAASSTAQVLNAGSGWGVSQIADLDGDGKDDIVWQHTDGRIATWIMRGTTVFRGADLVAAATGWNATHTGDFDGDGKLDLLLEHADGRAAIYLMDGILAASTAQILSAGGGWSAKRIADLNGDGKADIVWRHTDGRVAAWLMQGGTMTSGAGILGAATGWSIGNP